MNKRIFLKTSGLMGLVGLLKPSDILALENPESPNNFSFSRGEEFKLPEIPYPFESLEPHIDKMTMEIHHGKHHAAYVKNLNDAVKGNAFEKMSLEQILASITEKDTVIRNNGGGHYNHSLFWTVLSPKGGGSPSGKVAEMISGKFSSFEKFKEDFGNAAKSRFGSGWAWLVFDKKKGLFISSTPNQDNPLMSKLVKEKGTPVLGLDVWEHAYYLKYQNKRADYINAFWNIVNWDEVAKRLESAMK